MELTSAPLHKGQVPWRGLLLAALLLTYCNSSATAQARLAAVPPNVVVGASVILEIHDLETKIMAYYWYRGPHLHDDKEIVRFIPSRLVNMRGPAHTGREKVYQDGFMLLENVNKNDAGTYTARLLTMNYDTLVLSLQFQVYEPVNVPSIEASKTVVKELESVSLTCSSNDPGISFRWLFKGEHLVLTDRMKLSDNNRILTIDPVKLEDSGEYKCEVSNPANFKDSDAIVLDIIPIYGKRNFWHSWGPIIGIVAQCLLGLAALIILVVFLLKTIRGRNLGKKENINQMKDGRKPAGK